MNQLSALTDRVVIVGAGLAGLAAALHLQRPSVILSPTVLGRGAASFLAQGGIASAVGRNDSPEQHAADTLAAGAGLCDPVAVERFTKAGPAAIARLRRWGVSFAGTDQEPDFHLEGAHSRPRILHLNGDQSGAGIMNALMARVRETERITVLENVSLTGFSVTENRLCAVKTTAGIILTATCLMASGGIGGLFAGATCPAETCGKPLAQASRIGARLGDMEFTQFHPTALARPLADGRRVLVSEAVRGCGGLLVDERGERFTNELQPRDVVSRSIAQHIRRGHRVFLDGRSLAQGRFSDRFPGITAACRAVGINPDDERIPVEPAMHYHMGGLSVDAHGRTTVPGLWACGEVACTGLHGANRLASNSLLEAVLSGQWAAEDIDGIMGVRRPDSTHNQPPESVSPTGSKAGPEDLANWLVRYGGILRAEEGLKKLLDHVAPAISYHDGALVVALLAIAARQRHESRGAHYRTDYPGLVSPQRLTFGIADLNAFGVCLS